MSMGGTTLTYNHAHPTVVEQAVVTLLDDETDSGSFSRTSPSSLTSHTSMQSDCSHISKRRRTNSYNADCSRNWQVDGSAEVSPVSQIQSRSRPPLEHSLSSPLDHVGAKCSGNAAKKDRTQSPAASKLDLLSLSRYPWDNHPIAVAIWLAHKIHDAGKNLPLEQDALKSNTPQRRSTRRSLAKNNASLYPVNGVRCSDSSMPHQPNDKRKDNDQSTMSSNQHEAKQSLPMGSLSSKSFHHLMDLEAKRIAPKLAKLKRFKPGFGDGLLNKMLDEHRIDADVATAGKLISNVLVALYPGLQSKSRPATDALVKVLDVETSLSPQFTKAFTILSNNPDVSKVVNIIVSEFNSSEFCWGLDGKFDAVSGLSNYHSPKTSHSPQNVNKQRLSIVTRALESHPASPLPSPSSFSFSSSSTSSHHHLPEYSRTSTSPISIDTQTSSFTSDRSSSSMPRQSSRIRKPTIRAMEAKLSSQARSKRGQQKPRSSNKKESHVAKLEEYAVATASADSGAPSSDLNKQVSDPHAAVNANVAVNANAPVNAITTVDTAPRSPKRPTRTLRTIEEIAGQTGIGPREPNSATRRFITLKTKKTKLATPNLPASAAAAAAAPNPAPAPAPASSSVLSSVPPEVKEMVEQLLELATAAQKPDFKPEEVVDVHRARRNWYAEQLAASLKKAAEKTPEASAPTASQATSANGSPSSSSQPTASAPTEPPSETGAPTPATTAEDAPVSVTGLVDTTIEGVVTYKDVAAAAAPSSANLNEAAAPIGVAQAPAVENIVSDKNVIESAVSKEPTSSPDQISLDPSVLSHSYLPRPWTDSDGWVHTGLGNEHNDENVIVPDTYTWIRPRDSFNDPRIPQSPPQLKSLIQVERDDAFGYPPPGRKPNLPLDLEGDFVSEDVDIETEKAKVFQAARTRGILVDRSMDLEGIKLAIERYDEIYAAEMASSSASDGSEASMRKSSAKQSDTSAGPSKKTRVSRKRTAGQALEDVVPKQEDDDDSTISLSKISTGKRRRLNAGTPAPVLESASTTTQPLDAADPADADSMDVDSKPAVRARNPGRPRGSGRSRGPGRPSKRATDSATTTTTTATRESGTRGRIRARQPRQRGKRTALQPQPASSTTAANEMTAPELGPANDPVPAAAATETSSNEKDAPASAAQTGQEAPAKEA
ncbi:hypothetical protein AJ79_04231 [Helicocarpus griseus UAMH5409]|uniref:Uncharacterized protein n=1 Tax=Helicocarpus griseus UAMH5409 TaxID=1447875 RepID=A0A2B7XVG9_9EURO|nr:hypothetical protein AJ79_04231 [Helicocarpus griseus UAMH5409]